MGEQKQRSAAEPAAKPSRAADASAIPPGSLAQARLPALERLHCDTVMRSSHLLFALTVAIGLGAVCAWAATTELDQVTRGSGTVTPGVRNQTVQHLEGGIVAEIVAPEGARVRAGQAILRVIDQRWISALEQSRHELEVKRALRARLAAEASAAEAPSFPLELVDRPAARAEMNVFEQRRVTLEHKTSIFDDQIRRRMLELAELQRRRENMEIESALSAERVTSLSALASRGAVSRNDLLAAKSELQQLRTRITDVEFQIPQIEAELSETRRRRREALSSFRAEAGEELGDVELEIAKLTETVTTLADRERRADIVAPVDGVINKLFVSTIGGVVQEGQILAEIVPDSDTITLDVRVSPEDRARVWPGMRAVAKVTAYDFSLEGGLEATVEEISADAFEDERGQRYFRVKLAAATNQYGVDKPVLPGMTVTVDMLSGRRTILSYLLEPVAKLRAEALRE